MSIVTPLCKKLWPGGKDYALPNGDIYGFDAVTLRACAIHGLVTQGSEYDGWYVGHVTNGAFSTVYAEFPEEQNMPFIQWLVLMGKVSTQTLLAAIATHGPQVDENEIASLLESIAFMKRGMAHRG